MEYVIAKRRKVGAYNEFIYKLKALIESGQEPFVFCDKIECDKILEWLNSWECNAGATEVWDYRKSRGHHDRLGEHVPLKPKLTGYTFKLTASNGIK